MADSKTKLEEAIDSAYEQLQKGENNMGIMDKEDFLIQIQSEDSYTKREFIFDLVSLIEALDEFPKQEDIIETLISNLDADEVREEPRKAEIPVPESKPIKDIKEMVSRLWDCKGDAQWLRDVTPKMTYWDMDQLAARTGTEHAWQTFIIRYPRLLRNLRDVEEAWVALKPTGDDIVAIGNGWDNFLKYFVQALAGTNKGCLATNEFRIRLGPLVLQVYHAYNHHMRTLAPKMRNSLPSGDLRNGIDKKHDEMYRLFTEGNKKTQKRVEDIFMKGATDQYGDVISWKRAAESEGVSYSVIAKRHQNDPIHGINENSGINIRLPLF